MSSNPPQHNDKHKEAAEEALKASRRTGDSDNEEVPVGSDVNAGDVAFLAEPEVKPTHKDETARTLAFGFMWIFAIGSLVHYLGLLITVQTQPDAPKILSEVYNLWLPVVSSLVSATATYYFARSK